MDNLDQAIKHAFLKAFEDTFEGIAFAQVLHSEPQSERVVASGDELCAYIDLAEPQDTRFFFMMSRDHALECFGSIYTGIDLEHVDEVILLDFVSELTNTAAGHFTSAVAPDKKDMVIGLPAHPDGELRNACLTPGPKNAVYFLQVEDYPVYVALMQQKR